MKQYFKIGEISKLYHIGVDALRYYEEIGLLHPMRAESGYRFYSIHDIWQLNVIRDLREIGFSMEQIRESLTSHNTESTIRLLEQEQMAIQAKLESLQKLNENVKKRLDTIQTAQNLPFHMITQAQFPARRCHSISEGYTKAEEMDILIKRLINMDQNNLYIIGNNQVGTVIPTESVQKDSSITYQSVFVLDERGDTVIPEGTYLCAAYRSSYDQSAELCRQLIDYAAEHDLTIAGDILEFLWIDIHTTSDETEYVTQLQMRVEK